MSFLSSHHADLVLQHEERQLDLAERDQQRKKKGKGGSMHDCGAPWCPRSLVEVSFPIL